LIRFSTKGDAWNFLWQKVRENNLCPKLSGLQVSKGLCFEYQTGGCKGACLGVETAKKYNRRVENAIHSFHEKGSSVAIIGRGRHQDEQSLVLVEEGNYFGFGFFGSDASISDMESARSYVRKSIETPTVQNLINSYLMNPRGSQVITFG
jgi:DNA polymerase-3 subunit epsilon